MSGLLASIRFLGTQNCLQDQHAVSITKESVTVFDSFLIGAECKITPAKAETNIISVDLGKWKFVSSLSTC